MKTSQVVTHMVNRFPGVSRGILDLSVGGYLPPIHKHWLLNSLARDLYKETGFPIWRSHCRLHIPKELHSIYLDYFNFLDHEPLTRRVFVGLLKPGSVVVDVGANIGYFTLLAAERVRPRGIVHAVECSRETLTVLRENVSRNFLSNVVIHPVAAAASKGEMELNVSAIGLSSFALHENWPKTPGRETRMRVLAVPLDEIISSPVDVVKIDAEGADLDVLKGMERIISENPNLSIIVEWAPALSREAGKDPLELPRWLEQKGFTKITVLDELTNKPSPLAPVLDLAKAGKLSKTWVSELFAKKR